jgi:flavin reductase (DIM6/NTAB) family NADH-FMN oxidoreductase RutF
VRPGKRCTAAFWTHPAGVTIVTADDGDGVTAVLPVGARTAARHSCGAT